VSGNFGGGTVYNRRLREGKFGSEGKKPHGWLLGKEGKAILDRSLSLQKKKLISIATSQLKGK